MKDKFITLAALLFLGLMLGTLLDGAKAQNQSQRGRAPHTSRQKAINACMKLPDIKDVQVCVEAIK